MRLYIFLPHIVFQNLFDTDRDVTQLHFIYVRIGGLVKLQSFLTEDKNMKSAGLGDGRDKRQHVRKSPDAQLFCRRYGQIEEIRKPARNEYEQALALMLPEHSVIKQVIAFL